MKNNIIRVSIILLLASASQGYAQNLLLDLQETLNIRNPFETWLPKVEEKIEIVQEPDKIINIVVPGKDTNVQPTIVQPVKEVKPPKVILSGLVWSSDRPQAIINDQVVSIGDMIEDSKVVDIHKDGVDLMRLNTLFTIRIDQTITQST